MYGYNFDQFIDRVREYSAMLHASGSEAATVERGRTIHFDGLSPTRNLRTSEVALAEPILLKRAAARATDCRISEQRVAS